MGSFLSKEVPKNKRKCILDYGLIRRSVRRASSKIARLFLHGQSFDWNTEPFRGDFAILEPLDVQWRVIGHKRVNFNEMGDLRVSD